MAKKVDVQIKVSGVDGYIIFKSSVSEKSKLSLADKIWYCRAEYKKECGKYPKEITITYL